MDRFYGLVPVLIPYDYIHLSGPFIFPFCREKDVKFSGWQLLIVRAMLTRLLVGCLSSYFGCFFYLCYMEELKYNLSDHKFQARLTSRFHTLTQEGHKRGDGGGYGGSRFTGK